MTDVVIDNPILNSPYEEPSRHFRFSDEGITDEIDEGRRGSGYFVPVPAARTRQPQLQLQTQWTEDRFEPNDDINQIRDFIARWRATSYGGVTSTTRELLDYWTRADRERPLFFAQRRSSQSAVVGHTRSRSTDGARPSRRDGTGPCWRRNRSRLWQT